MSDFKPFEFMRAVREARLGGHAKAVLVRLATFADREGSAYPSLETLAEATGFSRATVCRCLPLLRELGWLQFARRRPTTVNVYHLCVPMKSPAETSLVETLPGASSSTDPGEVSVGDVRSRCARRATSPVETRSVHRTTKSTAQRKGVTTSVAETSRTDASQLPTGALDAPALQKTMGLQDPSRWMKIYEDAINAALKPAGPWTFPRQEWGATETIADLIRRHCGDEPKADEWLRATVSAFVHAVLMDDRRRQRHGLGPRGLLAWLNDGRPGDRPPRQTREGPSVAPANPRAEPPAPPEEFAPPAEARTHIEALLKLRTQRPAMEVDRPRMPGRDVLREGFDAEEQ